MLYLGDQKLLIETVAPGLARSDGRTLDAAGLKELAGLIGGSIKSGPVEKVALVFMVESDARPFLAACEPLGLEVRAIVAGAEKVLLAAKPRQRDPLEDVTELAGHFLAHAVWCVSDGATLIPIIGYSNAEGRGMERVVSEKEGLQKYLAEWMAKNPRGASHAVVVLDAFVTLSGRRMDALVAQLHELGGAKREYEITLPYRPRSDPKGFAVFKPKFALPPTGMGDTSGLGSAFFRGVDQHEQGAKVWNAALDQSF